MKKDPFYELGAAMAASRRGVDSNMLKRAHGWREVMESDEAVPFRRELCKIAYTAFEVAGEQHRPEAILFDNLAQTKDWSPGYNRFTDCVLRALSKQTMGKEATALLPAVAALHDKAGGGALKTLTAGGALGGAALGSLMFLLSRNAQQSSAENAALLEKIKAYKILKRDIEEDMESSGAMDVEEESPARNYDV